MYSTQHCPFGDIWPVLVIFLEEVEPGSPYIVLAYLLQQGIPELSVRMRNCTVSMTTILLLLLKCLAGNPNIHCSCSYFKFLLSLYYFKHSLLTVTSNLHCLTRQYSPPLLFWFHYAKHVYHITVFTVHLTCFVLPPINTTANCTGYTLILLMAGGTMYMAGEDMYNKPYINTIFPWIDPSLK